MCTKAKGKKRRFLEIANGYMSCREMMYVINLQIRQGMLMSLNNIRALGSCKRTQPQSASLLCFLPSPSLSPLQLERINYWFSTRLIITINCQIHLRVYCRDINNTLTLQSFGLCRVSSGREGEDRGGSQSRIHYPPKPWFVTARFSRINKNKSGEPLLCWLDPIHPSLSCCSCRAKQVFCGKYCRHSGAGNGCDEKIMLFSLKHHINNNSDTHTHTHP